MSDNFKILAINPGSTSTKIAVFENDKQIFDKTLRHSSEEIEQFAKIADQFQFRKDVIESSLKEAGIDAKDLSAVVGRGGLLKPIKGGTYRVNDPMIRDLKVGVLGQHASNLGGIIAKEMGDELGIPSFIVDPVVVDELSEVARISGIKEVERTSIFHALNQKAIARRFAAEKGKRYEDMNFVIAHMGGGMSIGAHQKGKVVDVANALDGEGPFSPERSGAVPAGKIIDLCFSGKYTEAEMHKMIKGGGGLVSYMGTNNAIEVEKAADAGNEDAKLIYKAMAYQVAKEIGACATVLEGKVDAILLTGGIAYSKAVTDEITKRVEFIAEVKVYPGEDEMQALALGGLRVLKGEEEAQEYVD